MAANAKSCVILTFLLGLTWSVGFGVKGELAQYAAYAFVALNGSVGLFLLLHTVLLNESVAGELAARLGIARGRFRLAAGGDGVGTKFRRGSSAYNLKKERREKMNRGRRGRRKTELLTLEGSSFKNSSSGSSNSA